MQEKTAKLSLENWAHSAVPTCPSLCENLTLHCSSSKILLHSTSEDGLELHLQGRIIQPENGETIDNYKEYCLLSCLRNQPRDSTIASLV